jgi:hypothetical protein
MLKPNIKTVVKTSISPKSQFDSPKVWATCFAAASLLALSNPTDQNRRPVAAREVTWRDRTDLTRTDVTRTGAPGWLVSTYDGPGRGGEGEGMEGGEAKWEAFWSPPPQSRESPISSSIQSLFLVHFGFSSFIHVMFDSRCLIEFWWIFGFWSMFLFICLLQRYLRRPCRILWVLGIGVTADPKQIVDLNCLNC